MGGGGQLLLLCSKRIFDVAPFTINTNSCQTFKKRKCIIELKINYNFTLFIDESPFIILINQCKIFIKIPCFRCLLSLHCFAPLHPACLYANNRSMSVIRFNPINLLITIRLYGVKIGSIKNRLIAKALIISIKNAPTTDTMIKA